MFNWVLTFHVAFMVAWFAGLFYLPRLFVYHAEIEAGDHVGKQRFCTMERRLSVLMSIAALGTIICGIWLVILLGMSWFMHTGWFHAKLALVILLIAYHGWTQIQIRKFRKNHITGSSKYYRLMNELPTIFLILILALVFVKPF